MLLNQQHQADIDGITPMPTDRVDDTSVVNTASAETVVWYYSDAGVRTAASGQAAGTMCEAKLTYSGVLNDSGSAIGNYYDTSLSFAAATRASTLVYVPEEAFSKMLSMSYADKMTYIATWLDTNGDYAIDHRRGQVWLLTKADPTNDAATYEYATPLSGGGAGDKVDVIKLGGVAMPTEHTAMPATPPVMPVGGEYRAATDTYTDGDTVIAHYDINGNQKVVDKAYDSLTQANKTAEVNPLNQQYVGETLLSLTNIAQTTTGYGYLDMSGYRYFTLQGETSGATPTDVLTVTVEATCQDDGTAAASCTYQDVTNAVFGVASWVDTDFMAVADTPQPFKYVRVKYVTSTGGGNDADLTVYAKRMY